MNMLNTFKTTGVCALFTLFAAGCAEDQTSLDLNSVPGRTTIIGNVFLHEGTVLENNSFKEVVKAAADKEIIVEMANDAFQSGQAGVSSWSARTNSEGKFEISIPTPRNGAEITVKANDFEGTYSKVGIKNNEPETMTYDAIYKLNSEETRSVAPGKINHFELSFVPQVIESTDIVYDQTVSFSAQIGMGQYIYRQSGTNIDNEPTPYFVGVGQGKDVILSINDGVINERFYNLKTDNAGKIKMNIPVTDIETTFSYSIKVLPFVDQFSYYKRENNKYTRKDIQGIYEQRKNAYGELTYKVDEQKWEVKHPVVFMTTPYGDNEYVFDIYDWEYAEWLK